MIRKRKNKHGEVDFDIVEAVTETPIEATVGIGDERIVVKGNIALEKMTNSNVWGNQIQIVLFGKEAIVREKRANNTGFNRIEIALPMELGKELFEEFNELLKEDRETKQSTLPKW